MQKESIWSPRLRMIPMNEANIIYRNMHYTRGALHKRVLVWWLMTVKKKILKSLDEGEDHVNACLSIKLEQKKSLTNKIITDTAVSSFNRCDCYSSFKWFIDATHIVNLAHGLWKLLASACVLRSSLTIIFYREAVEAGRKFHGTAENKS